MYDGTGSGVSASRMAERINLFILRAVNSANLFRGLATLGFIFVKLRERERHRVDQGKKRKKNGWWMVDILSLMLYTKFG